MENPAGLGSGPPCFPHRNSLHCHSSETPTPPGCPQGWTPIPVARKPPPPPTRCKGAVSGHAWGWPGPGTKLALGSGCDSRPPPGLPRFPAGGTPRVWVRIRPRPRRHRHLIWPRPEPAPFRRFPPRGTGHFPPGSVGEGSRSVRSAPPPGDQTPGEQRTVEDRLRILRIRPIGQQRQSQRGGDRPERP